MVKFVSISGDYYVELHIQMSVYLFAWENMYIHVCIHAYMHICVHTMYTGNVGNIDMPFKIGRFAIVLSIP